MSEFGAVRPRRAQHAHLPEWEGDRVTGPSAALKDPYLSGCKGTRMSVKAYAQYAGLSAHICTSGREIYRATGPSATLKDPYLSGCVKAPGCPSRRLHSTQGSARTPIQVGGR